MASQASNVVELFLHGAEIVAAAVTDPAVVRAWDRPSVLEDQRVSGLAGHLARGGVWVVADYLDLDTPAEPVDFTSAGEYFAALARVASPADHEAVRQRGADVGAAGPDELARTLETRITALEPQVRALNPGHLIAVIGKNVMRLDDYLTTRIIEQVVHLDDLARSVDVPPWTVSVQASELTIAVGAEIARRRAGSTATIRALYRGGFAGEVFPVL